MLATEVDCASLTAVLGSEYKTKATPLDGQTCLPTLRLGTIFPLAAPGFPSQNFYPQAHCPSFRRQEGLRLDDGGEGVKLGHCIFWGFAFHRELKLGNVPVTGCARISFSEAGIGDHCILAPWRR